MTARTVARDYIPISHTFPSQKPHMDGALGKRKALAPISGAAYGDAGMAAAGADSRVQALRPQAAAKRHCLDAAVAGEAGAGSAGVGETAVEGTSGQMPPAISAQRLPPTDFSVFNQQIKQERQQAGRQGPALKTFDDVTSAKLPEQALSDMEQLEGLMLLDKLQHASQSRDAGAFTCLDRISSAVLAGTSAAAAPAAGNGSAVSAAVVAGVQQPGLQAQQQQQQYDLQGLAEAPWDWSLKTRLKLSSTVPFRCLQEAPDGAELGAAGRVSTSGAVASSGAAALSSQEQLQLALLQWQHPAQALAPEALQVLHGSKATAELVAARVAAWRSSFRAVFNCLRHGQVPALYVVGRPTFTALFCSGHAPGRAQPYAVVTRVSKPLVQALQAAGVVYSIRSPKAPTQHLAAGTALGAAGAGAGDTQQGVPHLPQAQDWAPNAQLLVRGARHKHGLFLALLQMPWAQPQQPDVPLLLAPAAFPGATLCQLQLRALPGAPPAAAAAAAAASLRVRGLASAPPPVALSYAECSGQLLAPWSLQRLLRVLQERHIEGFEAYLESEPCSSGLNLALERDLEAPVAAPHSAICKGLSAADMLLCWGMQPCDMHGRVVKQVRFNSEGISVRLAAAS